MIRTDKETACKWMKKNRRFANVQMKKKNESKKMRGKRGKEERKDYDGI